MKPEEQNGLQISILESRSRYIKELFFSCLKGFLLVLVIVELLNVVLHFFSDNKIHYDTRWILENTALEMHAEDIWRHGRSTLKTFDPLSCKVGQHYAWPNEWLEVTCTSEDEAGQYWAYTVLYGTRSSPFSRLIPFFKDSRTVREMRRVDAHQMSK